MSLMEFSQWASSKDLDVVLMGFAVLTIFCIIALGVLKDGKNKN